MLVPAPTTPFKEQRQYYAQSRRIITIILSHDTTVEPRNMRCLNCGKIVLQYYNDVRIILDGAVMVSDCAKPLDRLCDRCNIMYRIS